MGNIATDMATRSSAHKAVTKNSSTKMAYPCRRIGGIAAVAVVASLSVAVTPAATATDGARNNVNGSDVSTPTVLAFLGSLRYTRNG